MRRFRTLNFVAFIVLGLIGVCSGARAGQVVWNGSVDANWSSAANWTPPAAPVAGDDVVLTGAGNNPINQDIVGLNIKSLSFDSSATTAFTVSGNAITLTGSGTTLSVDPAAANHTIAADLNFPNTQSWFVGAGRDLTLSGAVNQIPAAPDGLYYKFDEAAGTTAADGSGNGRTANLFGGASFVAGHVGNGVQLDGSSGYVQAPSFQLGGGPLTFAAWVYSSNPTANWNRIFDFGDGPSNNNLLLAFPGTSGQMTLQNYLGGAGQGAITTVAVFPTNTWVHVAVTINSGSAVIYWNGVVQASGNIGTLANTARANQYIGKSNWPDALFNGIIDDFRMYNRALSAADVGQLSSGNDLLSPTAVLTKTGAGQLKLTGAGSIKAQLVISAGTFEGNSTNVPAKVTNNAALVFNQTVDGTYNGSVSGTGTLAKNGAAMLSVGGTNTYSGTTTINAGTIRVIATPGLLEGRVSGAFDLGTPNPGTSTQLTTRYANIIDGGSAYPNTGGAWADNTTFIYSGFINNPNGANVTYTFAEDFDDSVQLKIDGTTVLFDGNYANPTLGTYTLTPGLHPIELRLGEGGGGVGPSNQGWLNNGIGFGYDPLGQNQMVAANYSVMTDPGDGSLFVCSPLNALSTGSDFIVNGGATLDLNNFTATIGSLSGSGSVLLGAGSLRTGNNNASTTFSGVISGVTGTLTKLGTGTFILSGNNTYTGTTSILAGTLQVGSGGTSGTLGGGDVIDNTTLIFNRSDASAYTGSISGPGSLIKNGTGVLTLSGVSTFAGGTAINAGTIQLSLSVGAIAGSSLWLDGADANTLFKDVAGTIPVAVNGDTVALWKDKSGNSRDANQGNGVQQPLYNLVSSNGQSAVRFDGADDLLNVDLSFLAGSQYTFFVVEGKRSTQNSNYFLGTSTQSTNEALHVGYRGDNDYTLAQYANDMDYVDASLQFTGTQIFRTWSNMLDGTGHFIFLNGTQVQSNGNSTPFITANGGTVGRGFAGGTQYNGDVAEVIFFNSALTPSARKAVDTYLFAKWNGILPAGGAVSIAAGATLDLNGVSQTIASLADVGGAAGTVTNNAVATSAKLTVNSPGGTATFSGVIQDGTSATGFVKDGAFTQILAGANTQTGGTFVRAGTLQVGDGGLNGSIAGDIVDNANLVFSHSVPVVYAGVVSGIGSLGKTGSGTLVLTANQTYTGATTVSAGILRLSGANASINASSSIVLNTGTLDIDSSAGTSSRIGDATSITFNAGTFSMTAPIGTPRLETVGALIFNSGSSTISITPDPTADAQLLSASFTRVGGATFNFVRVTAGAESANLFTGGIPDNTFVGYATVNNGSAQYTTANGLVNTIPIFTVAAGDWDLGTNWSGGSAPTVNDDVIVRHAMTLPGNRDVRSLAFDIGTPDISGAFTLNDNSGLVTCSGAVSPTISSNLTTAGKWNIIQGSTGTLSISGSIGPNIGVPGAVGHWTFEESTGSTAADASGNGNNGTLMNDVTHVPGRIGSGALQFGGGSSFVDIPGFTWPNGGGPVSVSYWNFVAAADLRPSYVFGIGNDNVNRFSSHSPWVDNNVYWDYPLTGTGRTAVSYSGYTDKWTHVTLVSEGNGGSFRGIYFDGVLVASAGVSDGTDTVLNGLNIGRYAGDPTLFHKGAVDDFRIYNRVLTGTEVAQLAADDTVTLTKSGTGTLALSGANVYGGTTTVSAGVVSISNSSALGSAAGGTIVASGAALELSGNISIGTEALVLNGTGIANGGALRNVSGTNSIAGSMNLASDTLITVVGAAETLTINGGVAGAGALTKNGPGTLILGGTSTNTSTITLSTGTLQGTTDSLKGNIVDNATLIFDQTINGGYSGNISGTGTFTKNGSGVAVLSGNNTYAGTTSILAGTLKTVPAAPAPGSALWLDAAAVSTFTKDGSNRISEWRDRAGGIDKVVQGNAGQQPTYVAAGINGLPSVRVNSANGQTMTTLTNFAAPSTVIYVARELGGTNRRVLSGINNNWLLGFFNGGRSYAYFNGWVDSVGAPADTSPYLYSATIPGPGNNSSFYENGALLASNNGGIEGPNGLTLNGQFGEYSDADIAEILVYKTALSDGARQSTEAYLTAKWFSSAGKNIGNALPDGTAVIVSPGATLDITGVDETIGSLAGDGTVLLGAGTLTTGGNNASTTYTGVISGSLGNLTKVGSGTFILTGANTYGGTTTVSTGVLRALNNTSLGSAAGGTTVASGAALEIDGGLTLGAEALTLSGTGVANGGALRSISGDNFIGAGAITLAADATINVVANSLTLNGGIDGAFGITKTGAGLLALGGYGAYTGATTISQGTLKLLPAGAPTDYAAYYSFDNVVGTTVFNDGPLVNKDGKLMNGASITSSGKVGSAMTLNALSPQFMAITLGSNNKGLDLAGGDWSISTWFNGIFPANDWRTLVRGNTGDHQIIVENGSTRLGGYDNSGTGFRPSGYDVAAGGVVTGWHQLTAVATGGQTLVYIDGVQVGTIPLQSTTDIYAFGNLQASTQTFGQKLDEFYFYKRALTPLEVQKLTVPMVLPAKTQVLIAAGATLDVNGNLQTVGSIADNGGAGNILLGAGTLTTGADNSATAYSGTISGTGALTKVGTGTFDVSGNSTYGGATTINAGILRTSSVTALPVTTAVVLANAAGAELNVNIGAATLTIGSLAGGGSLGGNVTLGAATLAVGADNSTTQFGGVISGTGGVVKNGTGTLALSGSNVYSGATVVNAGTLKSGYLIPAGSVLWLDATDSTTMILNGANRVNEWHDEIGGADKVVQGNASQQPTYLPNGLNGLPVVRFAAGQAQVLATNTNFGAPSTVLYVGRLNGGTNQRLVSANNNWLLGFWGSFYNQAYFEGWVSGPGGYNANTNAYVFTGIVQGAGLNSSFYSNGTLLASNQGGVTGPNGLTLGGWSGSEFSDGDIAEVLVYPSALSDTARQQAEAYLTAKWFGSGLPNAIPDNSNVTVAPGATLDLSSNSETIGSLAGDGFVLLNGRTLTAGGTNATTTYAGVISGPNGSLTKLGSGAMTLSGVNSYTGATSLNGGSLLVDGSIGAGAVTTLAGTTLGGGGTIGGNVTAGGDVLPGNGGIGALSVSGTMDFAAGASFTVQLDGTLPSSDVLNVTGAVTIGANVTLNATLGTPTVHLDSLMIINNGSAGAVTGTFNGLSNGSTLAVAPRNFAVRYDLGSGNDVVLIDDDPPTANPQTVAPLEDVLFTITLSGNDPNGDPLTFVIGSGPSNGTLGMVTQLTPNTASVTYIGNLNFNGADSFTFTVNDGTATSAPATVTVNVTAVNDAPSFTKGTDPTVLEDAAPVTIVGWATAISAGPTDEIGQSLTFNVTGNTNPTLFSALPAIASNGDLTFTPAPDANGSATITLQLQDDGATANGGVDTSAAQTFTIFVTAVNDVPSFTVGADQTVTEDSGPQTVPNWITVMSPGPANESAQILTFNVTANTNSALFSVQPSVSSSGTLTYTPAANANGSATITLRVQDNGGTANGGVDTSATQTFVIDVTAVNDPPVATPQTVAPLEDVGLLISLAGADSDPEVVQTLTYAIVTGPTNGTLTGFNPATGQVTYTGFADYYGPDSFTFTVTDDNTAGAPFNITSAAATVTINVTPVNDAPSFTAGPDQLVLEDAGPQSVAGWATGLSTGPANESTQTLSFVISGNTNAALFSAGPAVASDGTLTYTTAPDGNGSATITLLIMDSGGTAGGGVNVSATQTFNIDVTPLNDQPIAVAQSVQTGEDIAVLISLIGDDADPEVVQTLTYAIVTQPTHGTLSGFNPATGQVTYTPNAKYNGTDSFTFTVTDDGLAGPTANLISAPGLVSLTVTNTNNVPTTSDQSLATGFQVPLPITLVGDDGDPDAVQVLTFKIATPPANGLLSNFNAATGTVTYTPNNGFTGVDSFAYTVTDDATAGPVINLTSAPGTISITVTPPPSFGSTPTVSPDTAVVGQLLVFSAGTVGTSTIVWDFGDGVTANGGNAMHTYTVPGIYTASVTATSPQGVTTTFTISIFVGLDTTTGSSAGATVPGVTGILVGGSGQQKTQGGTGKMYCNFDRRDRTWVSGSVGQIAFPSGTTLAKLVGENGILTLGKGSFAQTFYFTLDKRGRGKSTSLPKIQVDLKKKIILFKVNNRPELTDLAESLGATFVPTTKKGPPVIVLLPATIQISSQIYLAITFELVYRQTGRSGKAGLKP